MHELLVVKGRRKEEPRAPVGEEETRGQEGRYTHSRVEGVSTLGYRGHRKCSSGINKAIVDYGSDIAPELGRVSAREKGQQGEEERGEWRKGRVKMGRAVSVIVERRRYQCRRSGSDAMW